MRDRTEDWKKRRDSRGSEERRRDKREDWKRRRDSRGSNERRRDRRVDWNRRRTEEVARKEEGTDKRTGIEGGQ